MHILHVLFSPSLGGLEQAYVNITGALASHGHTVTALLRADAPYRAEIEARATSVITAEPRGYYDVVAMWKIRRLLKKLRPDLVLAHNARSVTAMAYAVPGLDIPVVGMSHSYKTPRMMRADWMIVLTEHMRRHFIAAGYPESRLRIMTNMTVLPQTFVSHPRHTPLVIGTAGRFRPEKGFQDFLQALYLLKQKGVAFEAHIAGEGPEMKRLHALEQKLGLTPHIRWQGWIHDKDPIYRDLDVFCMPSRDESFGIVMLEALAHGVPIVTTNAHGPASIITHGVDGIVVPHSNPEAMARGLAQLVADPVLAARLAAAGWQTVQKYEFSLMAKKWEETLGEIISATKMRQAA